MRLHLALLTAHLSTAFLSASIAPSLAQDISALRSGDRIRLDVSRPSSAKVQGRLVSFSRDTIVLGTRDADLPIAFSNVNKLEVKRRNGGSFMRSAAIGLLGGAAAGALIGASRGTINTGDGRLTAGDNAVIGSIIVGGLGLIGGTVFGVCCASSWHDVPLPRPR